MPVYKLDDNQISFPLPTLARDDGLLAIGGTLFIFSGIVIDKNAERKLMAGRSFLDKNNYNDPFKNQRYYIYRW